MKSTFLLAAWFALACSPLSAQEVRGTLTGGSSGQPVAGAFVTLQDSVGRRVAATLSTGTGQYQLRAPQPGRYRLRIERLGLAAHETESFPLEVAARIENVRVPEVAIALESLQVRAGRRECRTTGEMGAQAAVLWEEARKALSVAAWSASALGLGMRMERRMRETSPTGLELLDVTDEVRVETGGSPWQSVPAAELMRHGFVRRHPEGLLYYGPDAEVLLSPEFLATHCFSIEERGPTPELIGLSFQPRGRSRVTDIRGTLWLDRRSAALSALDFAYVSLPYRYDGEAGGRVEFRRVASGAWIVSGWQLRLPRSDPRIRGLVTTQYDARALDVHTRTGETLYASEGSAGDWDPEGGRPADFVVEHGGSIPVKIWLARQCGHSPRAEERHVAGRVLTRGGAPLPGATVAIRLPMPGGIGSREVASDARGVFYLCDIPAATLFRLEASAPGWTEATYESRAHTAHPYVWRELTLEPAEVRAR